jgi:predicted nucleotidyltransferase
MADLDLDIIKKIVKDTFYAVNGLKRVGIVGSYARGDYSSASDVDLVFDTESEQSNDKLTDAYTSIKIILADQFNAGFDAVRYQTVLRRLENPENLTEKRELGYRKMIEDLIWIWERGK